MFQSESYTEGGASIGDEKRRKSPFHERERVTRIGRTEGGSSGGGKGKSLYVGKKRSLGGGGVREKEWVGIFSGKLSVAHMFVLEVPESGDAKSRGVTTQSEG